MELTVKDILKRDHFQDAEILTGKKGLHRKVTWAHVVEIDTFGHLLNGLELILTTGIAWEKNKEKSLHYLQQLLDHNASALCIELGKSTKKLPQEMLTLAEQNDFPIISFNKEVKFIDITKDIHQVLLGYQKDIWWDREGLYEKLNKNLISDGSVSDFLKILHQGTNKQVVLVHRDQQSWFFPPPSKKQKEKHIIEGLKRENIHIYSTPIHLLHEKIAQLYIIDEHRNISSFEQFSVKRCSEVLAQYFWKFHQQVEVEKVKKNEWMVKALSGALSREEIIKFIHQQDSTIPLKETIIGVIPYTANHASEQGNELLLTGLLMSMRTVFNNEGFYLLIAKDNQHNCYMLLLINQSESDLMYPRLNNALDQLKEVTADSPVSENIHSLSFGKIIRDYDQLPLGYRSALSTLNYQKNIETLTKPFYNNLTIYRLAEQFKDTNELQGIIDDYIGPLISYDLEKNTELLKTLKIYLKNLGAKNETARELYIVRQTLYHRLDRIKKLIGIDYKNAKQRVMIEFAIYTLEYLKKNGFKTGP